MKEWFVVYLFWIWFINLLVMWTLRLISFGLSHILLYKIHPYIPDRYKDSPMLINMSREDWAGCEMLGRVYVGCIRRVMTIYQDPQNPTYITISLLPRTDDDRARG